MNIKDKTRSLVHVLPEKDQKRAFELIDKDDFQTLLDLINSDIHKAKRDRDSNPDKLEHELHISDMQALKVVVNSYIDEEESFYHSLDTSARMMLDNEFNDEDMMYANGW